MFAQSIDDVYFETEAAVDADLIRRIDLNLLWVFQAIYSERNLTRASRRLALTQPTLSHALARLRDLTGDPLFVRTPRGMAPTARADAMAPQVAAALDATRAAFSAGAPFDPATAARPVRLSLLDYEATLLLPRLASRLAHRAPGLDLRCRHVRGPDALSLLDAGEIDLAIGVFASTSPARFLRRVLFEEHFVVVAAAGHPWWTEPLTPARYAAADHLLVSFSGDPRGIVDAALASLGLARRVALTVPYFQVVPMILAETSLVATLPSRVAAALAATHGLAVAPVPFALASFTETVCRHGLAAGDAALDWVEAEIVAVVDAAT